MKQQSEMLARADIATICVFNSRPTHIAEFLSTKISDDWIALSDKKGSAYASFQVKQVSPSAGPLETMRNWKKYRKHVKFVGNLRDSGRSTFIGKQQLPADFMINEDGVIVDLFRAERVQDHMAFERIEAFIPESKRCRCNRHDCQSQRCREEYEEIRNTPVYMG